MHWLRHRNCIMIRVVLFSVVVGPICAYHVLTPEVHSAVNDRVVSARRGRTVCRQHIGGRPSIVYAMFGNDTAYQRLQTTEDRIRIAEEQQR